MLLVHAVIEQHSNPFDGGKTEMMPAFGADLQVGREVLVVDDLGAAGALDPQPFGDLAGLVGGPFQGLTTLLEPGHEALKGTTEGRGAGRPEGLRYR